MTLCINTFVKIMLRYIIIIIYKIYNNFKKYISNKIIFINKILIM